MSNDKKCWWFYIIVGHKYLGFGYTTNPSSRNSDYSIHGDPYEFQYMYRGGHSAIISLEGQFKRGIYTLREIAGYQREWFDPSANLDVETFKNMVDDFIDNRNLDIVLCAKDYVFTDCPGIEYLKEAVLNEED